MAHQSLYRRYRPQRFDEVRGQDHVITALRSAVAEGRVGHAYLFSGPRGTGKTSTARILAKALNCENLGEGEPCGACDSCLAMQAGTSYDLQELDAASNNKVEDVRGLIERVALGSPGRTKVYILDEVHMLSTGASNALLKTLEEPPDHVVFVLATTDPQKVLPTIRSRTQHFVFHLLPAGELADHVRFVIDDAGLDVDDAAIEHVLRVGGGSARDTLSALDQAAAGGVSTDGDHAEVLASAVVAHDVVAALSAVATATVDGRDPRVLGEALLAHLRDVFLHRMGGPVGHLSDAARQRVAGWADQVTDRSVTAALQEVGEALLEMRQAPDPRIPLEVALVRVTRQVSSGSAGDLAEVIERVERLEARSSAAGDAPEGVSLESTPEAAVSRGPARPRATSPSKAGGRPGDAARAALGNRHASSAPRSAPSSPEPPPPPPPPPPPAPPPPSRDVAGASDTATPELHTTTEAGSGEPPADADLGLAWSESVLPRLKGITKPLFAKGQVMEADGASITLGLPNQAHLDRCGQKHAEAEAALAAFVGRPVTLVLVVGGDGDSESHSRSAVGSHDDAATATIDAGDDIDLGSLVDAPTEPRSGIDRVTEAFPGAQIVDR